MPEERKLVTVLFADIVGSTTFGREHDPELVRRRLREVFADMRAALVAYGASVEKFIGDAVMAVFGVPAAHEDDPERALRAAFEIRGRLGRAGIELPLAVRIGITTGEAVADTGGGREFLVTGDVVNAAARLQQLARPGEILVGTMTRELTRGVASFGPARALRAKGLSTVEASLALSLSTKVSERDLITGPIRAPLIGRENELRLLRDTFQRVASERRAYLVTIFGGPGIGKSRLAREFIREIGMERSRIGRCLPYGSGITFYALQQIIHSNADIEPTDAIDDARRKLRSSVERSLGTGEETDAVAARTIVMAGLGSPGEDLADFADNEVADELHWGVRRYFEAQAMREPLVLVFEDIHWAEPALLDLIEQLADSERAPLLIVCLARPELLDVRGGWGGGHTNASAIALQPLTPADTRELIRALRADPPIPEELIAEVLDRSEGNPLYVEEFSHLLRIGDRPAVPPTIQGLIAARLDRSPPELKRWLQVASVFGRVFWTGALAAIGGAPGPTTDLLHDAVRRGFIGEADEGMVGQRGRAYRFMHVLIREVAYGSLPKSERAILHDRCALWYEETLGDRREDFVDVIAHHSEQAFRLATEVHDPALTFGQQALERLLPAAVRARERGDSRAAHGFYARSLEMLHAVAPKDPRRAAVLAHLLVLRHQLEPTPEHEAELDAAIDELRGRGGGEPFVLLLIERLRSLAALGESSDTPLHDEPDPDHRETFDSLFREAEETARAVGDPSLIAQVMLVSTVASMHDRVAYRAAVANALSVVRATGSRRWLSECMSALANAHAESGEIGMSLELGRQAYELARTSGSRIQRLRTTEHMAAFHRFAGDYEEGVRFAEEGLRLAQEIGTWELAASLRQLGLAYAFAGSPERARVLLEPYRERLGANFPFHVLVQACVEMGDTEAARGFVDEGLHIVRQGRVRLYLEMLGAEATGNVDEALRIYHGFVASHRFGSGFLVGNHGLRIARSIMRRGRVAEARELLNEALQFYQDPAAFRRRQEIERLLQEAASLDAVSQKS